jgi:hypothetical protein
MSEKCFTMYCLTVCIGVCLALVGIFAMPEILYRHVELDIKIHYVNTTIDGVTEYVFVSNKNTFCNNIHDGVCNNITKCPKLAVGNTYEYYCDCLTNICSFETQYNIYTSWTFLCLVIGFLLCCILPCCVQSIMKISEKCC